MQSKINVQKMPQYFKNSNSIKNQPESPTLGDQHPIGVRGSSIKIV
jgi:hypothetical protein